MSKLPKFLKKYFWDVDFENIKLENRRVYILKRILEYGDEKAVGWMRGNFTKEEMKDVLIKSRGFSKKSANFWAFVLDVEREKVKCLNKSFQKTQNQFWPY
jgi:N-acetylmuramic acid 6-phosphate (MurNAc-6-P) etherase